MFLQRSATRVFALFSAATVSTFASTYYSASFNGNLAPGNANVKAPFNSVISQGDPVSGSFVFDSQLVPGAGTGFVNVFFSDFPEISSIPNATAFNLNLGGGIVFDLGSAVTPQFGIQEAAIQYKNGAFNGFFFVSDFTFQGNQYELNVQGETFGIRSVVNGYATGQNLVRGTLDSELEDIRSFTPASNPGAEAPEPGSSILIGAGLIALVAVTRMSVKPRCSSTEP